MPLISIPQEKEDQNAERFFKNGALPVLIYEI
jgi:hypothetical protein